MSEFHWVAVAIVSVLSSARITRLITVDSFPPSARVRIWWDDLTNDGPWSMLVHCGYCFGLWAALLVVGSGYLSDWHTAWWLFNGWMSVGYAAAIVMANDGDEDED